MTARVETLELDERKRMLSVLGAGLTECAAGVDAAAPAVALTSPERSGELGLLGARLRVLAQEADVLRAALASAAAAYERAEEPPPLPPGSAPVVAVVAFARRAEESLEHRAPTALADAAALVRATTEAVHGVGAALLAGGDRAALEQERDELVRALLGDPLVLEGIRALISTIGLGTEIGVLLLPPPIAAALGAPPDERVIGTGVGSASGVLVVLGTLLGAVPPPGERRLRLEWADPPAPPFGSVAAPPRGWGELAGRVPPSDPDGPQVVIERYGSEWLVAVSGTTDWSGDPAQAFGAAANLQAMSGGAGTSVQGTLAAMEAAGVPPGAPVTIVAHSQGGLIAARVAQSGRYDVHDVVAFGSPIRGLDLPDGTRTVSVEHSDDLVPALAGFGRTSALEPGVVRVERGSDPVATLQEGAVPAHALHSYVATAQTLDSDPRLAVAGAGLFALWRSAPDSRVGVRLTTVPVSSRGPAGTDARGAR
ncbi:alpha/beta hydrolase [Rathayibacter caricis]|uniref:alpha/beta hydrolase n=1 Tax=Rathayibacter caricis TaxID=110936 RepID=UPI001FB34E85|nr:alpha/beta hydrolase [Rathayibacter caricis]MCJ1695788.1 alpha/beta hydrolase [Rathayibacter caricis]